MLNNKQKLFCQEYLKDCSPCDAALRANYAPTYGSELLKNPEIKKYLADQLNSVSITPDFVLAGLKENAIRCMGQPATQQYSPELDMWVPSNSNTPYPYNPKTANSSLELLGKNLKLFTTMTENTNTDTVTFNEYVSRVEADEEY